jgi:EAL domain-containing protein (putative c-di-GMP-specific phosphodiesterase class I)
VFEQVAARVAEWDALQRPFSVAVNVSPPILVHAEFSTRIKALKAALDERGFGLTIEITEDSLVQGDESALAGIERLRKLGVDFALDDFGKGYSSLGYLKELPATEIKIDKRFIGTIATDATDREIVKTVVALARALGMRVVAEGIDNAEALRIVTELGCEMAQGFFIGRPSQREIDALEDCERFAQQLRRIASDELRLGTQPPFRIRMQRRAKLLERSFLPNGRQRVLQHASLVAVHVNVAGSDQRHAELDAQRFGFLEPWPIVARVQQLDGHPEPAVETLLEPAPETSALLLRSGFRQPEQQAARL